MIQDFTAEDSVSIGSFSISSSIQSDSDVIISFVGSNNITLQNTVLESLSVHDSLITYGIDVGSGSDTTGSGSENGSDTISGSLNLDGNDTIYADGSRVTILTAEHGSSVYAYGSNNTIDAGAGSDFVSISSGSLYIIGGYDDDSIYNDNSSAV